MGLSLWLVPTARSAEGFNSIMRAVEPNGSHSPASYPKFYPHITLASLPSHLYNSLQSIKASIPTLEEPLQCHFASVDVGTHYFRSVYIAIEPTSEIVNLHRRVHEALRVEPETPSFPHMSLCYIGNADAEKGERAAFYNALKDGGKLKQETGPDGRNTGVTLDLSSDPELEQRVAFVDIREVWAVQCEGPVEGWAVLGKYPLTKG